MDDVLLILAVAMLVQRPGLALILAGLWLWWVIKKP